MNTPERWLRLKELFFVALERPAAEREGWIASFGAGDAELAPELRALLAEHDEDSGPFARATREAGLRAVAVVVPGSRIGPYEIERPLGEGGMGAVFLAQRADDEYRQEVAIKVVRAPLLSEERLHRFRLERQTLAELAHPGIARLLDGGTTPEGWPYLVMEYVAGSPIDRYCDSRALSIRGRVELFRAVLAAVEHAHRNLVVHRDLKPSNILVSDAGEVKLVDFGIAKLLPAEDAGAEEATRTIARVMTPEFASPEQILGAPITTATDVYSLGVLLYRLLAGSPPYRFDRGTLTEIVRAVCQVDPPPPSTVAAASGIAGSDRTARELRGDLDNIVLLALRKEPERRYPSVAAFDEDLRRYLEGLPVDARGDSISYRAGKFARRHRLGVVAAAIAVVSLVAGTAVALWQAGEARKERDRARTEATRSARMNEFLRSILSSPDPMLGGSKDLKVAELLARASTRLGADFAGEPGLEASLRGLLGETEFNLGLIDEAVGEEKRAVELARRVHGAAAPETARAMFELGVMLDQAGRFAEAETTLDETRATFAAHPGERGDYGHTLDELDVALQNQGKSAAAIAAGRESVEVLRALPGERAGLAPALNNLAIALGNAGRLAEAEPLHRESVALSREVFGEDHPKTAEALGNLAGILDIEGKYAEADPVYREALALKEKLLGERHFDFIRTLTSYANFLALAKRFPEAEAAATRALALARASLGAGHPTTAYAENILGGVLLDLGRAREAEPHIRTALELRRERLGPKHWLTASAQSNLGATLFEEGRLDEAERELTAAYAVLLADRGPDHEKTKLTAERLAKLRQHRDTAPRLP